MSGLLVRIPAALIVLAAINLPAFCGELDDYYLSAYSVTPGSELEKAVLYKATETSESPRCGTTLKRGLTRNWDRLEPATQKVLAKQLALPILSNTEQVLTSSGGHFRIHYTTAGIDAPNITNINFYTGLGLTSIEAWIAKVGDAFETAYSYYQSIGYRPPPKNPCDVYLKSLSGNPEYGATTSSGNIPSPGFPYASGSFIEIDKDFTNSVFKPGIYTPLQSLQVTSAHEFHHAIQYGYNYYFESWYAEATSTWFEDEVHDNVNQLYNYISPWLRNSRLPLDADPSTGTGGGYGRWIFNRFLAEKNGAGVVKGFWESLAGIAPNNEQDIPMAPVMDFVLNGSLGSDFRDFAKRVYTRDWKTHTGEIDRINLYSPVSSFSAYPVSATSVTLPHYSFAFYRFLPSQAATTQTITMSKTSGIQAAVFKKTGGRISEIPVNAGSLSYTVSEFNEADEVVLLIVNTTDVDNHSAIFNTDGSSQNPPEPSGGSSYNSGGDAVVVGSSSSGSGGGGGCFIATAAYGSYLHPQVRMLRDFRDQNLLSNSPGRAFVAIYYRVSPQVAGVISQHETLRIMVRLLLTPLVFAVAYPAGAATIFTFASAGIFMIIRRRQTNAGG
jgi:hypothetical protein